MNSIPEIVKQFQIEGEVTSISPFGDGLINESFKVSTTKNHYFLQKINHSIFKDIEGLQNNIILISKHIESYLKQIGDQDVNRKRLNPVYTKEKSFFFDGTNYWRMFYFIQNSVSFNNINPEYAAITGHAIAQFQKMLANLDLNNIVETIPDFHNLEFRLTQLNSAIQDDKAGRLNSVKPLLSEILEYKEEMLAPERWFQEGKIRKYIQHCDTKINNLLFDQNGSFLCMVDLDTCMPNFFFSDIGDFARTACNKGAEDDADLTKIEIDYDIYKRFKESYLTLASDFLTPFEISKIDFSPKRMTYMQTIRFFTDYLNGDSYYKIKFPEHNLQRTKAQFTLFLKWNEMKG